MSVPVDCISSASGPLQRRASTFIWNPREHASTAGIFHLYNVPSILEELPLQLRFSPFEDVSAHPPDQCSLPPCLEWIFLLLPLFSRFLSGARYISILNTYLGLINLITCIKVPVMESACHFWWPTVVFMVV